MATSYHPQTSGQEASNREIKNILQQTVGLIAKIAQLDQMMPCGLIRLYSRLQLECPLISYYLRRLVIFQSSLSIVPIGPLKSYILTWHKLVLTVGSNSVSQKNFVMRHMRAHAYIKLGPRHFLINTLTEKPLSPTIKCGYSMPSYDYFQISFVLGGMDHSQSPKYFLMGPQKFKIQ